MKETINNLPRNVILDLLPAYIAGEASKESRALVEEYAEKDPEIAGIIQKGDLESDMGSPEIKPPDDLEMKTIKRIRRSIRRQILYVAVITASLLMIPLLAMLVTDEVNWTLLDFAVMGALLLGTGLTFVFISRKSPGIVYKIAVGIAVLAALLLVWVTIAVGIIGSEDNPVNMMYLLVLVTAITGAWISRFKPRGMAITMLITALIQILIPVIALAINRPALDEPPGIAGVFIINAFFAVMFAFSGLLFRYSAVSRK